MFSNGYTNTIDICQNCVKRCDVFKLLTKEETTLINENRIDAHYAAGEIIFKQGSPVSHVVAFSSGLGKMYVDTKNRRYILSIVTPTTLVTDSGNYTDGRHQFTLSALNDSDACFIDISVFRHIMKQNSHFAEGVMKNSHIRFTNIVDHLIGINEKQMHGRVADALLYLSQEIFKKKEFDLLLSRQDFADMTGMSKESLIRILKEFKDEDLINMKSNEVEILNIKSLLDISAKG